MAFVFGDRCKEISTTVGTGTMTLGGPTPAFVSFAAAVGVTNETYYGIVHVLDNSWELGRGTVGAGTLSRDTVLKSSNSNLLVNFQPGDKLVFTTNPALFYASALDVTSHAAVDHTLAPLNLLDATAHQGVDHTAAPLSLLNSAGHDAVDHTAAPFNLLNATGHQGIDHTIAPFNLLNSTLHNGIDHTTAPLSLMSIAAHNALDHTTVPATNVGDDNPAQVSPAERTAGTEAALRSYSPLDVATMANLHGPGGASGKVLQTVFAAPITAVVACVGAIPLDDTKPQIGETSFVIGATITPASVGNTLVFQFSSTGQTASGGGGVVCLFQGAGPDPLAAAQAGVGLNGGCQLDLTYYMNAPSSGSPITFNIHIGKHSGAGTWYVNGNNVGTRNFGGAQSATFLISELAP